MKIVLAQTECPEKLLGCWAVLSVSQYYLILLSKIWAFPDPPCYHTNHSPSCRGQSQHPPQGAPWPGHVSPHGAGNGAARWRPLRSEMGRPTGDRSQEIQELVPLVDITPAFWHSNTSILWYFRTRTTGCRQRTGRLCSSLRSHVARPTPDNYTNITGVHGLKDMYNITIT